MDAIDVVFPGASRLRNLESKRQSDTEHFWPSISEKIQEIIQSEKIHEKIQVMASDLVCRLFDAYETLETLKTTLKNSSCDELKIGSGGYAEVNLGIAQAEVKAMYKLSDWEIVNNLDKASFYQSVVSSASPIRERNGSITDASCGFKPNCKCSHHSHKNHTVQFSNVSLDENLEPIIYDTDVSKPCDRNHIWGPEFASQTKPWIFDTGASFSSVQMYDFHPRAVGVAKGHIMTRNSSVRCPLRASFSSVQMHDFYPRAVGVTKRHIIKRNSSFRSLAKMLLGMGIEVPVSWHSLILMTRYLKQIGIFHRCLSLLILAEAPTEKKTVANGNGKGADNGSSEEVSSYQANDGLNASTETPISQSERSSISSPDETATVDISSIAPTRTLESTWYIASAAAHHMTGVQDLLTNYTPLSEALDVHTPNMGRMQVLGSGSVNTTNITLQDVWFVPGLDANLVSTNQLTKLGHTVSLGPDGCRINKDSEDGALIGLAHFTDDYLFKVDFLNVQANN